MRITTETRQDRLDDTLGLVRIPDTNTDNTGRRYRVVVATGKQAIADKEHFLEVDTKGVLKRLDSMSLIETRWAGQAFGVVALPAGSVVVVLRATLRKQGEFLQVLVIGKRIQKLLLEL